jgi:hypothetical protein
MKVWIITSTVGNGEQYEDYRETFNVEGVFSSKQKAEEELKKLPKSVAVIFEPKYAEHFTGWTSDPEPWYETDENGEVILEPILWEKPIYSIEEHEIF